MSETKHICGFQKAWIGECKNPPVPGEARCPDHKSEICVSCQEPATHECAETGQFVCGAPLCDGCEHAIAPDGTNGGIGFYTTVPEEMRDEWKSHIKRSEQKYLPWYARERASAGLGDANDQAAQALSSST